MYLELSVEKQRYDGWYNNRANPDWGSVGNSHSLFCLVATMLCLVASTSNACWGLETKACKRGV